MHSAWYVCSFRGHNGHELRFTPLQPSIGSGERHQLPAGSGAATNDFWECRAHCAYLCNLKYVLLHFGSIKKIRLLTALSVHSA